MKDKPEMEKKQSIHEKLNQYKEQAKKNENNRMKNYDLLKKANHNL